METCLQGRVRISVGGPAPRTGNQALEISTNDSGFDPKLSWLERADPVGQVWGSSPHGPTISSGARRIYSEGLKSFLHFSHKLEKLRRVREFRMPAHVSFDKVVG